MQYFGYFVFILISENVKYFCSYVCKLKSTDHNQEAGQKGSQNIDGIFIHST